MITREQVADIITTALASAQQPEDAQAFAQRLATALDALGLIQFCDVSEDDNTTIHEHTDPEGLTQKDREWLGKRDRTADR